MIILLIASIIALIGATFLLTPVIWGIWWKRENCSRERLDSSLYSLLFISIIFYGLSIFGFITYHNNLINYAMSNMEIGNYTKIEYRENGIYKVKYHIDKIDFD